MEAEPLSPRTGVTFRRLWALVRPYLGPLLLSTFLILLDGAVVLAAPRVAGLVVDAAVLRANTDMLNQVTLLLIGLFAGLGVLSFFQDYLLDATGARFLFNLRAQLFEHLIGLTPEFYETRRVGELLSRLGTDLAVVQRSLTSHVPNGIYAVLTFIGTLVILLVLHTKLTLVALGVVPPVILVAVWYGGRLEKMATQVQDALAETSSLAEEALAGLRTVQSFTREDHEVGRYRTRLFDLLKLELRNTRLLSAFAALLRFAAFSAFAVVLWYGGRLIAQSELTPGELTSFLLYTFSIAGSVGTLGGLYAGYKELRGASARVFELLDTLPTIQEPSNPLPLSQPRGHVAFRQLSFSDPSAEGRRALDQIDLTIEPGEMVALVVPSGAGKSTLFSLLLRS